MLKMMLIIRIYFKRFLDTVNFQSFIPQSIFKSEYLYVLVFMDYY